MSWRCVHPQVNFPTKHLDSQLNQTKGLSLKFSNAEIQLRINTSPSPATQSWNLYSRHHEVFSMQSNLHSIHQLQKAPPVAGSALWCRIAHWALLRKAKLEVAAIILTIHFFLQSLRTYSSGGYVPCHKTSWMEFGVSESCLLQSSETAHFVGPIELHLNLTPHSQVMWVFADLAW